jgi:hypothetical protein
MTVATVTTGSVLNVEVNPDDGTTHTFALNSGAALTADCLYTFVFSANEAATYNFQFETACDFLLTVEEIQDGGQ